MVFETEVVKLFMLVMVRISGLIVSAPVLGSGNFPARAKAGLAALMAMLVVPTLPALATPLPDDPVALAVMGVGELLIGLILGFVMTILFAAVQVGGQLMDMTTGFGLINVFNPALETQVPIFGFFFFIIAVLYLLISNGHHYMLLAVHSTFERIPPGGLAVEPALLWEVSTWGKLMFYDGLLIAAPVVGAMLLAYVTMGIMGRLVPQIHLLVIGFPLTIAIGLLVVAFVLSAYLAILEGMFARMFENVETAARGLG